MSISGSEAMIRVWLHSEIIDAHICSDQAEKTGYDLWHPRSETILIRFKEGAVTTAAQAFLLIGGTLCFSFAAIYVFWFADRLRSNFLGKP